LKKEIERLKQTEQTPIEIPEDLTPDNMSTENASELIASLQRLKKQNEKLSFRLQELEEESKKSLQDDKIIQVLFQFPSQETFVD